MLMDSNVHTGSAEVVITDFSEYPIYPPIIIITNFVIFRENNCSLFLKGAQSRILIYFHDSNYLIKVCKNITR